MERGRITIGAKTFLRLVLVLSLLAGTTGATASTGKTATSQRCGVDQDQPAQRILADPDGKHGWREYQSVKDVPEIELGFGESARLWAGSDGNVLIRTEEPGEDFAAYTDYCFDRTGQLVQLRFELRTAWGWGYRKEGLVANKTLPPRFRSSLALRMGNASKGQSRPLMSPRLSDHICTCENRCCPSTSFYQNELSRSPF